MAADLCRKHGISEATFYAWRSKYGGMGVSDARKLNHKRLFRLYREERLCVRKRGGRKRALGTPSPMALPEAANQRWSLDLVSDALSSGRRFRVLAVVDNLTRECLGLIVSDNGTELTSNGVLSWAGEAGIDWHYIAPG